jgi:GTP cyclohydrolase IA
MNQQKLEDGIRLFLEGLGLNVDCDQHLRDTPARVGRAWANEFASGYTQNPSDILNVEFSDQCQELIIVKDIPFVSHCAHHIVPFSGVAHVGYLPRNGRITGLSKLARVVDCYAHRLQIQERLTRQVATAIDANLQPEGVGVVMSAVHSCMVCRGVRKPGAVTITSCLLGSMKDDSQLRSEFLSLVQDR